MDILAYNKVANLAADTALLKTATAVGCVYGNNLNISSNTSGFSILVTLTGKYELLGLQAGNGNTNFMVFIDGSSTGISFFVSMFEFLNLSNLGIKCNNSMVIYKYNGIAFSGSMYRLLP